MKRDFTGALTLSLSLFAHVPLVINQGSPKPPRPLDEVRTLVEFVVPKAPEPPPPEPETPPPPQVAERPPPMKVPKLDPKPDLPAPELTPTDSPVPEPQPETAPEELTGTTLTGDVGAAWSSMAGSGAPRNGAIGAGLVRRPRATPPPQPVRPPATPAVVPIAELSRKPEPPPLHAVLERHYPKQARNLAQSGEAKVRARVEADGRIREASIKFESGPGFGAGCRAALLESRWSAPLDRQGKPVTTWITYRCKFRVTP